MFLHTATWLCCCVCRGPSSARSTSCLRAVLNTLPESDAAFTALAEIEGQRWICESHAHSRAEPYIKVGLQGLLTLLRKLCLTTAFSHTACSVMLEQLEGTLPLGDWGTVIQVRYSASALVVCEEIKVQC